jgi:hypothetical protein
MLPKETGIATERQISLHYIISSYTFDHPTSTASSNEVEHASTVRLDDIAPARVHASLIYPSFMETPT